MANLLSKSSADGYYASMIKIHLMNIGFIEKISQYKNMLENNILPEITKKNG